MVAASRTAWCRMPILSAVRIGLPSLSALARVFQACQNVFVLTMSMLGASAAIPSKSSGYRWACWSAARPAPEQPTKYEWCGGIP